MILSDTKTELALETTEYNCTESVQVTAPVASRPVGPTETRELFADVDPEIPVVPTAAVVALAPEKKETW